MWAYIMVDSIPPKVNNLLLAKIVEQLQCKITRRFSLLLHLRCGVMHAYATQQNHNVGGIPAVLGILVAG